jgi:ribonuclease P protein component
MSDQRQTFPKTKRIRTRTEFNNVFQTGTRKSKGPLTLIATRTENSVTRLGLSVPKRVGTAPRRNRIKRLLRESFRQMQHHLPKGYDLVILVRPHEPLKLAGYQELLVSFTHKMRAQ